MPDLGTYATEVLSAYAVSLLLIGALVWRSLHVARGLRAAMERAERSRDA
jgi:heme exporter protein D